MLPKRKINKTRAGFGLLEALIASGIIIMVSTASVGLANGIIKSTATFNDRIVADNLATEAIEVAFWMRDNYINDNDTTTAWDYGFKNDDTPTTLSCNNNTRPCDIYPVNSRVGNLYFKDKDDENSAISIGRKDYVRKIWAVRDSTNENIYKIQVKVFRQEDLALPSPEPLSDLQTIITNWKEPR